MMVMGILAMLYVAFFYYSLLIFFVFVIVFLFVRRDKVYWYIRLFIENRTFRYKFIIANAIIFIVIIICLYSIPFETFIAFVNAIDFRTVFFIWFIIIFFIKKQL